MRVFVTGATGFVGRALIPRLQRDGHAVVAWVRSPARARGLLGAEVELVHADTAPDGLPILTTSSGFACRRTPPGCGDSVAWLHGIVSLSCLQIRGCQRREGRIF
jgi:nucleoside-diphosphate-sugar epimerase